jgi:carbonic anhydrase/acetyltransferase-like protein (isoleucine patch superfamily)
MGRWCAILFDLLLVLDGEDGNGSAREIIRYRMVLVELDWIVRKPKLTAPPHRFFSHYPLTLKDHVFIGSGSIIEASKVGSKVHIGSNCVVGKFAVIHDCVRILDGTVVPSHANIPSFSIVGGNPGRVVAELPEGGEEGLECREVYKTV